MQDTINTHNFNLLSSKILNGNLDNSNYTDLQHLAQIGKQLRFETMKNKLKQLLANLFPHSKYCVQALAFLTQEIIEKHNKQAFKDLSNYLRNSKGSLVEQEMLHHNHAIPKALKAGKEILTPERHLQILRISEVEEFRHKLMSNFDPDLVNYAFKHHLKVEVWDGKEILKTAQKETLFQLLHSWEESTPVEAKETKKVMDHVAV